MSDTAFPVLQFHLASPMQSIACSAHRLPILNDNSNDMCELSQENAISLHNTSYQKLAGDSEQSVVNPTHPGARRV